ncbi:hypothetical protein SDC9_182371 [bioreactor metagenome]|jgi:hypothetical protein|uniref:Uncharacterized protein n=1 Tax=bioreactor metagenome TaxID=1076179 RepID=A0A645H762_9ZZZZ
MVEESAAVTYNDFRNHSDAFHSCFFEGFNIEVGSVFNAVVIHIEQRSRQQFGHCESLIESACFLNFIHQFLWHYFACSVMFGVSFHYLRFEAPVFHDLRRQFHKVA